MAHQQLASCGGQVNEGVCELNLPLELSAARMLLESIEWTCFAGKVQRIYPWDHGVWKCVRREGCSGWDSALLWYDAHSKLVWWSKEKKYFFDPSHPANEPGKIKWYSIGDLQTNPKVSFTWYSAEVEATRCADVADSSVDHAVAGSELLAAAKPVCDDALVCDNTFSRLSVFNVPPPPGLELPLPPGLEDVMLSDPHFKLRELDMDDKSIYEEATSAGCTTPCSERSEETSTDSVCDSPSLFDADAPSLVPILADTETEPKSDALQKPLVHRTPLKAGAALFQPQQALPFMPAADVAQAWKRQGYVQPAVASLKPSVRPAKKPLRATPLKPGLQSPGTLARSSLCAQ